MSYSPGRGRGLSRSSRSPSVVSSSGSLSGRSIDFNPRHHSRSDSTSPARNFDTDVSPSTGNSRYSIPRRPPSWASFSSNNDSNHSEPRRSRATKWIRPLPREPPQAQEYSHESESWATTAWSIYVSAAEKYDDALVESWKGDMDGLVIFSSLFSGIVAAFIIESYKTLQPDSGDLAVDILKQISQQLVAAMNGGTYHTPEPVPFSAPVTMLICNALWFISLALSLTCALLATLIQQWTRDFIHKTDTFAIPVLRARIFSYLHYGMKRFKMHTIVEILPLFLHLAFILFFAGLIAFLVPVNIVITSVVCSLFLVVGGLYFLITLLPVHHLDCPYRTPLSSLFWRLFQYMLRVVAQRPRFGADNDVESSSPTADTACPTHEDLASRSVTMVKAMTHAAQDNSSSQFERDWQALGWTVKSLIDDRELLMFVEGIPTLLWGPSGRRYTDYDDHLHKLAIDPEIQLGSRIVTLYQNQSGDLGLVQHRRVTCLMALWALASLATPDSRGINFSYAIDDFSNTREDPDCLPFRLSVSLMMQWSTWCSMHPLLNDIEGLFESFQASVREGHALDLGEILEKVHSWLSNVLLGVRRRHSRSLSYAENLLAAISHGHTSDMEKLEHLQALLHLMHSMPSIMLLRFIESCCTLHDPPFGWLESLETIKPKLGPSARDSSPIVESYLDSCLKSIITATEVSHTSIHWLDEALSYWVPICTAF
ncbi:hypothetical protein B0H14DRAFT_3853077 [Mycena olivaceomarginata]|nr:hypothetical protein B0H14DRAFT_3853077 [Mycena olivaceomarginata]